MGSTLQETAEPKPLRNRKGSRSREGAPLRGEKGPAPRPGLSPKGKTRRDRARVRLAATRLAQKKGGFLAGAWGWRPPFIPRRRAAAACRAPPGPTMSRGIHLVDIGTFCAPVSLLTGVHSCVLHDDDDASHGMHSALRNGCPLLLWSCAFSVGSGGRALTDKKEDLLWGATVLREA